VEIKSTTNATKHQRHKEHKTILMQYTTINLKAGGLHPELSDG
jgi:hypothetical protein